METYGDSQAARLIWMFPFRFGQRMRSLSSVLSRLLRPLALDWTPSSNGLLITTQEIVDQTVIRREYDVTDLVRRASDPMARENKGESGRVPALILLMRGHFADFWNDRPDQLGISIDVRHSETDGFTLVVLQTRFVHGHIAAALEGLRSNTPDSPGLCEPEFAAALEQRVSLDLQGMPLTRALQTLQDKLPTGKKIPIEIDLWALEDAGAGDDMPLTFRADNIPLRSALARMLGPMDLARIFRNEAMLITTQERASDELVTRVYNVSDLAPENSVEEKEAQLQHREDLLKWKPNRWLGPPRRRPRPLMC